MRKTVALLIAGLAAVSLAAACSSEDATPTSAPAATRPAATRAPTATPPAATATAGTPRMLVKGDDPRAPSGALDKSRTYHASIRTEVGDIRILLYDDEAPTTVENFINLARIGFYDETTFHRVIADFMAQGGDPTGTGGGGPGYRFRDEFVPTLQFTDRGLLAMANAGPNTNGSQFFITFAPTPHLNNAHTIFGKVISGDDVLSKIKLRDPASAATPGTKILTVLIAEVSS
jgi:cyclophilin family peptidyl-prolyl cis-trans isomerase